MDVNVPVRLGADDSDDFANIVAHGAHVYKINDIVAANIRYQRLERSIVGVYVPEPVDVRSDMLVQGLDPITIVVP